MGKKIGRTMKFNKIPPHKGTVILDSKTLARSKFLFSAILPPPATAEPLAILRLLSTNHR